MNIKDIAKMAGVGVSTVSRVINNHPDVKDETREKVKRIIKESNYIPNDSARILKKNNNNNIGVLVKGVFNPFFSEMISIISNRVGEAGYTMILQQNDFNDGEDSDRLISFVKEKRLQALICLGGNFNHINEDTFKFLNIPIILTSVNTLYMDKANENQFSSIGIDNKKAARDMTEYLINRGHKNIAMMLGDKEHDGISSQRLEGYKEAMNKFSLEIKEKNILIGEYTFDGAYKETKRFLKENKDITAIFAISDTMAVGASKAALDLGLEIGKDISISGFDGMDIAKYYNPGITTVKQPNKDMATNSIDLLLALLTKKENHKHIVFETKIIERESCTSVK
ncbi:MAG: LacI family DNA-binding transcriptional regulator [Clostridium sp.]|uniref:LacI family DNA-binding transcriptional regulator n=1 Tax=Clostridium TaxID=1485 RepID=UPI0021525E3F|nr:LacI family DNA-binding transcriptional regulator [Clostridium sp. LY3-2]MCR6513816.1 LacI family transcriptional regulator [Clostridium sp. LY3-2]